MFRRCAQYLSITKQRGSQSDRERCWPFCTTGKPGDPPRRVRTSVTCAETKTVENGPERVEHLARYNTVFALMDPVENGSADIRIQGGWIVRGGG
ncbi:hypothetical protein RSOLAG1IB_01803 [Rhizoctonia solani AG-1 IB]|uniref:Uncharacterized protein n=1 Tax=Thanatephorus cucumeris (strain AG1-IB / isolate 7/3/14) TaxID=1108050 RepID=A0A0B7FCM5_THACB|nr:hypothetical protein RSOLAG1IB_01803 [Rhizoctonia solani AG-1 IB]